MKKASEANLERLLKKLIRGQPVSLEEIFFHWDGLEVRGDRTVIRTLNRQNAWDEFIQKVSCTEAGKARLQGIADRAGVPPEAVSSLVKTGIRIEHDDSQRSRASWIHQVVREDRTPEWERARDLISREPELLEGTLELLERQATPAAISFLTTLLDSKASKDYDTVIRKAIYRLKQRGLGVVEQSANVLTDREIFFFGENRLPLWQPVFYYRSHSAFSDAGDLHLIQISEGRDFQITDQQRNVSKDVSQLGSVTEKYSQRVQQQTGLKIPFRRIIPSHARYFLERTSRLLDDTDGSERIQNFLKFMAQDAWIDPVREFRSLQKAVENLQIAAELLSHGYFAHWLLEPEHLGDFFLETEKWEKGPIILTEPRLRELRNAASLEFLKQYFDENRRAVWSLAFEKAAFFLADSEEKTSQYAWALSQGFANSDLPIEEIPAAAILFERSLGYEEKRKEIEQKEEKRASLIMTPQEFEQQLRKKEPRR